MLITTNYRYHRKREKLLSWEFIFTFFNISIKLNQWILFNKKNRIDNKIVWNDLNVEKKLPFISAVYIEFPLQKKIAIRLE